MAFFTKRGRVGIWSEKTNFISGFLVKDNTYNRYIYIIKNINKYIKYNIII